MATSALCRVRREAQLRGWGSISCFAGWDNRAFNYKGPEANPIRICGINMVKALPFWRNRCQAVSKHGWAKTHGNRLWLGITEGLQLADKEKVGDLPYLWSIFSKFVNLKLAERRVHAAGRLMLRQYTFDDRALCVDEPAGDNPQESPLTLPWYNVTNINLILVFMPF